MLRICIPVHNEATTIGVLLWRLRSVFQGFSREYDVVVYDDASTDGTGEVLEPYQSVMPLTVIRGAAHRGYAASIDALVRHVAADDEYARRDAMVLLQGDFTESPEHLPELVKRFEGGADLVAVHRTMSDATPADERRLRRWGRWAVKPFLRLPPVADPFTGFRLVRISVLRDLLRALGGTPVCSGEGWAANIDFALNVAPFARRIENVEFAPRYDVRQRASRRRGWADVVALFHWARAARSAKRPVPGGKAAPEAPGRADRASESSVIPVPTERATRPPDRSEKDRERGGRADRGGRAAREDRAQRDERPAPREERGAQREERSGREERPERAPRAERSDERTPRAERTEERAPRAERPPREPREERVPREPREPREEKAPRAERPPREPRPPRPERQPQPERESRAEVNPAADDATETAELTDELLAANEAGAGDSAEGAAPAGERKSRRRRRRSRKDRAERAGSGTGEAIGDGEPQSAGTSDDGEGEQEDGGDEHDSVEPGSEGAEPNADSARRKRRSRRRRRGRRPGGPDGATPDGAAPPAAEPPAA